MVLLRKLRDYIQLIKLRLSLLVIFSAFSSYFLSADIIDWHKVLFLSLGGLLVTGSANGFNEFIERDLDKKMNRTRIRPIPDGRMTIAEATISCSVMAATGFFILSNYVNTNCALISMISFLLYVFVYTPIKIHSPFAVYIGAFPGAMPVLIGASAVSTEALTSLTTMQLFAIQFLWQFPHFWSIAWVLDEDYARAGFRLLPSKEGKTKKSALQILLYTVTLFPVSLLPVISGQAGLITSIVASVVSGLFITFAIQLYRSCSVADAKKVMYCSFGYLPAVLIAIIMDWIF
ncbi:MAG: protoheme IX farnesyltransferase [Bacteroidetes bacterium]|nr:protoheme IX farnesyltransferase [Bacteroidota bacterium]